MNDPTEWQLWGLGDQSMGFSLPVDAACASDLVVSAVPRSPPFTDSHSPLCRKEVTRELPYLVGAGAMLRHRAGSKPSLATLHSPTKTFTFHSRARSQYDEFLLATFHHVRQLCGSLSSAASNSG